MKKSYRVEVDCANCACKMEDASRKVDGVSDVSINFMTQKMNIEFADGADINSVMKQVLKSCRKIESDCEIYF